jgi:spermidine synthase
MLLNDGLVMVTERDEFIYHDMITHPAMFVHPSPRKVLVIGGGDGGTAREVLRHPGVEKCVMCEIDEAVVEACRRFIPQTAQQLDHPKLELLIQDAVKYVAQTREKFDVILVDSTDPIGPAQPLFGPEFYRNVYNCLTPDGIVISQGESPFYDAPTQIALSKVIGEVFPILRMYNFNNMTYPGGYWSFSFASKKYHPLKDFDPARVEKSGLDFGYYNAELHSAAFCLPTFMKTRVAPYLKG